MKGISEKNGSSTPKSPPEAVNKPVENGLAKKEANDVGKKEAPVDLIANPHFKIEQALEKKLRNLEKRRQKLHQIKLGHANGEKLTQEQQEAILKLGEVEQQTDFIKELQKLVQQQIRQYQRALRQQIIKKDQQVKLDQELLENGEKVEAKQVEDVNGQTPASLNEESSLAASPEEVPQNSDEIPQVMDNQQQELLEDCKELVEEKIEIVNGQAPASLADDRPISASSVPLHQNGIENSIVDQTKENSTSPTDDTKPNNFRKQNYHQKRIFSNNGYRSRNDNNRYPPRGGNGPSENQYNGDGQPPSYRNNYGNQRGGPPRRYSQNQNRPRPQKDADGFEMNVRHDHRNYREVAS